MRNYHLCCMSVLFTQRRLLCVCLFHPVHSKASIRCALISYVHTTLYKMCIHVHIRCTLATTCICVWFSALFQMYTSIVRPNIFLQLYGEQDKRNEF